MRDIFVSTLLNIAKKDKNVLLVTGDLGFGVLNEFWKQLPKQIINVGIAEQNMIGFASGLAKSGKIVYVYSIANFPSLRPFEQIRNDVAYHNLNVKIISIGAGFSYGSLGITHHATEDIGVMRSLPNLSIYSPSNDSDTVFIANQSYNIKGPAYIRLGRSGENKNTLNLSSIEKDLPTFKRFGSKFAIFSYGEITQDVLLVVKKLLDINLFIDVFIFHTLKPFNTIFINEILPNYKSVFVIEEHSIYGGLSSIIKDNISKFPSINFYSFGIEDKFTSEVGDQQYLRKVNNLDQESLFKRIKQKLYE
jgi:transketolase